MIHWDRPAHSLPTIRAIGVLPSRTALRFGCDDQRGGAVIGTGSVAAVTVPSFLNAGRNFRALLERHLARPIRRTGDHGIALFLRDFDGNICDR